MRVLAVIVLYKMQPRESAAFRTLRAAISGLEDGQADIEILLYDNTPGGQAKRFRRTHKGICLITQPMIERLARVSWPPFWRSSPKSFR